MSDLPKGWSWATLGELGVEQRVSVTADPSVNYELYSVPAYATGLPENIEGSAIGSAKRAVAPGDVLLCKINPRINRVWIVNELGSRPQIASPEYLVLRTHDRGLSAYLRWYLSSPRFRDWITLSVEGATGSHTRAKSGPILRQVVPVPPLAEQRRIVEAIEEQLSRLDAAVVTLRAVQARAAMARRAVLAAAFSQYRFRVPLNDATDPQRPICYGILKPRTTGDLVVPYVEVRSIRDGRIDLDLLHHTTLGLHREFARSTLRSGDVVIAVRGSWDRAAVVPAELEGANVSRDVARVAPLPQMNAQFLSYFLASPVAGAYFASVARGVGVRGVNIGDLRQLPVPCPALEEQAAAVERVEAGLDAVERAGHAAAIATHRAGSLRRSILATAFGGNLVPQNESDEPASTMLERIVAERDVSTKPAPPWREAAPA